MSDSDRPIFREVQYIRSVWWIMLLVYAIAALMWWGLSEQIILDQPWGSNPGPDWMIWLFWIFIGIGFSGDLQPDSLNGLLCRIESSPNIADTYTRHSLTEIESITATINRYAIMAAGA